jgi:hypothetical protein
MVTILQGESKTEAIWERYGKGEIDKATIDRWQEDGTIDKEYAESSIQAGALQIIASRFVYQTLQERAGETEMRDGINKAMAARQKSDRYWQAKYVSPAPKGRKKRKPTARRFGSRLGNEDAK